MKKKLSFVLTVVFLLCSITSAYAVSDNFVQVAEDEVGTKYEMVNFSWDNYYIKDNCKYNEWFRDAYYGGVRGWFKSEEDKREYPHRTMWCATFVCWCANQAGVSDSEIPFSANVNDIQKWYNDKGSYQSGLVYVPKRGDLIFFHNGNQYYHIGIVKSVEETIKAPYKDEKKLIVRTIEGDCGVENNRYSAVVEKEYERFHGSWTGNVAGFGVN